MDGKELYDIWAPEDSIWSQWAKPVTFMFYGGHDLDVDPLVEALPKTGGWEYRPRNIALLVNLPGIDSIIYGLDLAQRGFRPVPLFNCTDGPNSIIKVSPIIGALGGGGKCLQDIRLTPDASPAFLIDSNRMNGSPTPGDFDNRWVVFPQDLPSAVFLKSHQIQKVILIQKETTVQQDIAHILSLWKQGGLEIYATDEITLGLEKTVNLHPISRFSLERVAFAAGLIASLGLRRSNVGGFGSIIPEPSNYG